MGRTVRRWLLALCLLGSLNAHAGSPVWVIHGKHNTVYLAGSIHLLKADDARLPPAIEHAYASSSTLVMELDLGKLSASEAADWMMKHGREPEGQSLRQVLGERRYQRLLAVSKQLGLPESALDQLAPWVVGLELLELKYAQLGFDPQEGVEQQLESRARRDGKATLGLETLGEQLGVFEKLSTEDQVRFLDLVVSEMQDVDTETESVVQAWRAGDAKRLATLLGGEYKSFPVLYRALVTERNRHWMPQIEKLLSRQENYLVVVGALHLVGSGGLLERLRHDGYRPVNVN